MCFVPSSVAASHCALLPQARDIRLAGYVKPMVGVSAVSLHGRVPWLPNYRPPASEPAALGASANEETVIDMSQADAVPRGPIHVDGATPASAAPGPASLKWTSLFGSTFALGGKVLKGGFNFVGKVVWWRRPAL